MELRVYHDGGKRAWTSLKVGLKKPFYCVIIMVRIYAARPETSLPIRAGGSRPPCGTIGHARLAEKMGGTGEGNF